jgi:hypothetical protein
VGRLARTLICILVVTPALAYWGGTGAQPQPRRATSLEVDEASPVVDSLSCPPRRPAEPTFVWTFVIHAHDEAPLPGLATPVAYLEYSYVFTPPPPARPIQSSPEFSRFHRTFDAWIDGQSFPGEYTYVCRVRDTAGNISEESLCRFVVGP